MSDVQERPAKAKASTTRFIFIGDPMDNGAGPRTRNEDDDDDFRGVRMLGFEFPKGRAVEVPLNATIGETQISVVAKLRGNSHFFEGTEEEFAAAKKAGQIRFKKAPEKRPRLIKNIGVRGLDHNGKAPVADDDDE